jgi:hypothetical protein
VPANFENAQDCALVCLYYPLLLNNTPSSTVQEVNGAFCFPVSCCWSFVRCLLVVDFPDRSETQERELGIVHPTYISRRLWIETELL